MSSALWTVIYLEFLSHRILYLNIYKALTSPIFHWSEQTWVFRGIPLDIPRYYHSTLTGVTDDVITGVIVSYTVTPSWSQGDVHCVPAQGRLRPVCWWAGAGAGSSAHSMCPHPTVLLPQHPRHSSCPGPVHPLISNPRMSSHTRPLACCQICHTQIRSKYL